MSDVRRTFCYPSTNLPKPVAHQGQPVIVTDSHYADTVMRDNRFYRESTDKMTECVELMNDKKVNFLIELGDFKDQDSEPSEERTVAYLRTIEEIFQQFNGPTYHVLCNDDVDSISKEQFQDL